MASDKTSNKNIRRHLVLPGVILLIGLIVVTVEFLISQFEPWFQGIFPGFPEAAIEAILLSVSVTPLVYFITRRNISNSLVSQTGMQGKILTAAGIPLLIAIAFMVNNIWEERKSVERLGLLKCIVDVDLASGSFIHEVQKERGISSLYVSNDGAEFYPELTLQRQLTDLKASELLRVFKQKEVLKFGIIIEYEKKVGASLKQLLSDRHQIDIRNFTWEKVVESFSRINDQTLDDLQLLTTGLVSNQISKKRSAYLTLMRLKELTGIERAILSGAFSGGQFNEASKENGLSESRFRALIGQQTLYHHETLIPLLADSDVAFFKDKMSHPAVAESNRLRQLVLEDKSEKLQKRLRRLLGYNGLIHQFKNYVLRGNDDYRRSFLAQYAEVSSVINELESFYKEDQSALEYITALRDVLGAYRSHLQAVDIMKRNGKPVSEIDRRVFVNDQPAIEALDYLQNNLWGVDSKHWFKVISQKINLMKEFENHLALKLRHSGDSMLAEAQQAAYWGAAIALALLCLVVGLLIVISRNVSASFAERLVAQRNAENLTVAKADFLASMSHEIRTPMNGVLGMLDLLLNSRLDDEQRHKASLAQSSAQSLLTLINDILDFSKVDAGKIDLEEIDFDLRNQLSELSESMAFRAQDKGLELDLNTTGIGHALVKGDPGRLRQILNNLVGNAIKFTQEGRIVIRARLEEAEGNNLIFNCSVTDTGIGVPHEKLENLFESFSQADASTTRQHGGTGLGLSIAKKMCELMGGGISVTSEPGKGSCFEFNITLQQSEHPQQLVHAQEIDQPSLQNISQTSPQWTATTRILLVEDNQVNQEVAKGMLNNIGFSVDIINVVADGEEALDALREADNLMPYSLVLMDCQMPVMDGYEASKQIRAGLAGEINQKIPIIAMTANAMKGDQEKCLDAGMSDYISKPVEPDVLLDKLKKWLLGSLELDSNKAEAVPDQKFEPELVSESDGTQEVWDKNALIKKFGDNSEFLTKLVNVFMSDMRPLMDGLQEAIDKDDMTEVKRLAHTVKGVAGNLNGKALQRLALKLEHAANEDDADKLNQLWPEASRNYQLLLDEMKHFLDGSDQSSIPTQGRENSSS